MQKSIQQFPLAVFCVALVLATGCSLLPRQNTKSVDIDPASAIPFPVKDPVTFSADVIVSTRVSGETKERIYFIAKDVDRRFETYGKGTAEEFSLLRNAANESFRLDPSKKEFEKLDRESVSHATDSLTKSLTSRWLNEKRHSVFVDLGVENGLRKYQVKVEDSRNTEILIFVDEKLKYPVKQQYFSVNGARRELAYSIELRNISTRPDAALFELPKDWKAKVLVDE